MLTLKCFYKNFLLNQPRYKSNISMLFLFMLGCLFSKEYYELKSHFSVAVIYHPSFPRACLTGPMINKWLPWKQYNPGNMVHYRNGKARSLQFRIQCANNCKKAHKVKVCSNTYILTWFTCSAIQNLYLSKMYSMQWKENDNWTI